MGYDRSVKGGARGLDCWIRQQSLVHAVCHGPAASVLTSDSPSVCFLCSCLWWVSPSTLASGQKEGGMVDTWLVRVLLQDEF